MSSKISLASSAMLVEVTVSCWSAKKLARKESEELTSSKSASKRAAQVQKNLLADDARLDGLIKFAAGIRNWLAHKTVPWSDSGARLVSTRQFFDFKQELDTLCNEFNRLVDEFVTMYPTLISAQAFKLGTMFDRSEFPSESEVRNKFGIKYAFSPIPESGDFRVDIADDIAQELRSEYEAEYSKRVDAINKEHWTRLKTVLDAMSERLGKDAGGKNLVFRDTLVSNALEMCELLKDMNVTNDQALELARRDLVASLVGVTPKELRDNEAVRTDVKSQVDTILGKFDWGM